MCAKRSARDAPCKLSLFWNWLWRAPFFPCGLHLKYFHVVLAPKIKTFTLLAWIVHDFFWWRVMNCSDYPTPEFVQCSLRSHTPQQCISYKSTPSTSCANGGRGEMVNERPERNSVLFWLGFQSIRREMCMKWAFPVIAWHFDFLFLSLFFFALFYRL